MLILFGLLFLLLIAVFPIAAVIVGARAEQFEKLTGWTGRTSIHARAAAWLII